MATHMDPIRSNPETADTDAARTELDGTGRKSAAVDSLLASSVFSPITVAFFNRDFTCMQTVRYWHNIL